MKYGAVAIAFLFASAVDAAVTKTHEQKTVQLRGKPNIEVWPVGEGAYQSATAVQQRTTDPRKICEEATATGDYSDKKWQECFKLKGDYTDIRPIDAAAQARYDAAAKARADARADQRAAAIASGEAKLEGGAGAGTQKSGTAGQGLSGVVLAL